MPSLYFHEMDPEQFRETIVSDVMGHLRTLLSESRDPRLVNGDRLAEQLGVSRPTVDRLRADGLIPSVLIGRRRLYRVETVIAALEQGDGNV